MIMIIIGLAGCFFRGGGGKEYITFDANNIVSISGNIFLYLPQGHPILYRYCTQVQRRVGL